MIPFPLRLRGEIGKLNDCMAKFAAALQRDPRELVRQQAGILSRELSEAAAPRSKKALERSMEKDIKQVYAPAPRHMLPVAHRKGKGFVWLMATQWNLTGVKPYDYHLEDSVEDMKRLFHKTKPRGERYENLGIRKQSTASLVFRVAGQGKSPQLVRRLNRIVVKRGVYKEFLSWMKTRAGILGGSWVVSWNVLQPKGRKPPAYKFRHVENGTAKGTYIDGLGIPGKATFTLVNRATGCEQPKQIEMVRSRILFRIEMMKADMKNLIRGAYRKAGFKRA